MMYAVHVLLGARDDYREIRQYVQHKFGRQVWRETDLKYKELLHAIGEFPLAGTVPDEAVRLGLHGLRQRLLGQTRVIYDIAQQQIFVHLFVSGRRDLMTMLAERMLRSE